MQVELLTDGGFAGMESCIGKQFDTNGDARNKDTVRLKLDQLVMAGFTNPHHMLDDVLFFKWEVRVID